MILNKSAVERGLAHGTLFKCEAIDLKEDKGKSQVRAQGLGTHPWRQTKRCRHKAANQACGNQNRQLHAAKAGAPCGRAEHANFRASGWRVLSSPAAVCGAWLRARTCLRQRRWGARDAPEHPGFQG